MSDDGSRALTVPKPPPLRGEVVFHQGKHVGSADRAGALYDDVRQQMGMPPKHPNCHSSTRTEGPLRTAFDAVAEQIAADMDERIMAMLREGRR